MNCDKQMIKSTGIECLKAEAKSLLDVIPKMDDDFVNAVELIYHCKGKVIITGVGKSGHVGAKISATMASLGTPSFFVNPLDAYHGDLGMFDSNDVVIAISYSGNTDELLRFIPYLLERKIPIISMTGNPESLLAKYSVFHLNIAVSSEADPLNLAPTSSTTAQMAMGDALACALARLKNFTQNDFARFHPGGTLGKKLLSRVKDQMITSDLPVVHRNTKVCDAMVEISKTKLGIAIVLEDNEILGVVTDGDVRRAMQYKQEKFFELYVNEIMSKSPKTINENSKLSDAESMMRKYNIHQLVVVDDNHKLAGIIDTFRCM